MTIGIYCLEKLHYPDCENKKFNDFYPKFLDSASIIIGTESVRNRNG